MSTLAEVRSRPFDESMNEALPALVDIRTPNGAARVGISREDAAEFFDSKLFKDGVVIVSVSGWSGAKKRVIEVPEALAALHQILGPTVLPKLRHVSPLSSGAMYFLGLVNNREFVMPTLLQDAHIARGHEGQQLVPVGFDATA